MPEASGTDGTVSSPPLCTDQTWEPPSSAPFATLVIYRPSEVAPLFTPCLGRLQVFLDHSLAPKEAVISAPRKMIQFDKPKNSKIAAMCEALGYPQMMSIEDFLSRPRHAQKRSSGGAGGAADGPSHA